MLSLENFKASKSSVKVVTGHIKYGAHHIFPCKSKYITFLRCPIERAVSHYYFIKDSDPKIYEHPYRKFADSVSLEKFYENPFFRNMQSQYIAGYMSSLFYKRTSDKLISESILENVAYQNLSRKYVSFGILENFEDSCRIITKKLKLENRLSTISHKKTSKRPKVQDLSQKTIDSLKQSNSVDLELYRKAQELLGGRIQMMREGLRSRKKG